MENYRNAVAGDEHGIASIHVTTWKSAYRGLLPDAILDSLSITESAAQWAQCIQRGQGCLFVCEREGIVVGFIFCDAYRNGSLGCDSSQQGELAELYTLYVSPEEQGKGVGTRLFHRSISWLTAAGYTSLAVRVLDGNDSAIKFYRRLGFSPVGEPQSSELKGVNIKENELILRFMNHEKPHA